MTNDILWPLLINILSIAELWTFMNHDIMMNHDKLSGMVGGDTTIVCQSPPATPSDVVSALWGDQNVPGGLCAVPYGGLGLEAPPVWLGLGRRWISWARSISEVSGAPIKTWPKVCAKTARLIRSWHLQELQVATRITVGQEPFLKISRKIRACERTRIPRIFKVNNQCFSRCRYKWPIYVLWAFNVRPTSFNMANCECTLFADKATTSKHCGKI